MVSGEGSGLSLIGEDAELAVGATGRGELLVTAGAQAADVGMGYHTIANAAGATGTLTVTGPETRFDAAGELVVGNGNFFDNDNDDPRDDFGIEGAATEGSMRVVDGARLTVSATEDRSGPGLRMAVAENSEASLTLDGEGTQVNVVQTTPTTDARAFGPYFQAGIAGSAEVSIQNQATLLVEGPRSDLVIGRGGDSGSRGAMRVHSHHRAMFGSSMAAP